ncbi:hypothetical protein BJV82DRAFT_575569 [Fennellomyces sp. T-0311]|nr:hypothetical protein BJV82DRAFT_575569 [Fennellomyces sp. T-0311]
MVKTILILNYIQLALAALVILALLFRAIALRQFRPYFGASIAALAYLLVPVLTIVHENLDYVDYSYGTGIYFLRTLATAMLWLQMFDSIWVSSQAKEGHAFLSTKLLGVKLGYLWSTTMVACAIAVCGYIGALLDGRIRFSQLNIQGSIHFLTYAPWGYILYALFDMLNDQLNVRQFPYPVYAYIFLLIIVNLGATLHGIFATNLNNRPVGMDITILILNQYFGLFAITVIIFYAHNWYFRQEMGRAIDETSDLEAK